MINILTSLLYGTFTALAFITASFLLWKNAKKENIETSLIFDWLLISVIFGIISARLTFIFEHFSVYQEDIFRWIHFIRYPGLSAKGFMIGAFLISCFFLKKKKVKILLFLDLAVIPILYAWFFLQSACLVNSCLAVKTFTFLPFNLKDVPHPLNIYYLLVIILLIFFFKKFTRSQITTAFSQEVQTDTKEEKHGLYFLLMSCFFFLVSLILDNFVNHTLYFKSINLKTVFNILGLLVSGLFFLKITGRKNIKYQIAQIRKKLQKGKIHV